MSISAEILLSHCLVRSENATWLESKYYFLIGHFFFLLSWLSTEILLSTLKVRLIQIFSCSVLTEIFDKSRILGWFFQRSLTVLFLDSTFFFCFFHQMHVFKFIQSHILRTDWTLENKGCLVLCELLWSFSQSLWDAIFFKFWVLTQDFF